MKSKQVLRVEDAIDSNIVSIKPAYSSYIDDLFYKNHMGEEIDTRHSFPVKVVALEIGWILNYAEGF
jgi:hypothetical protein